MAVTEYIGPIVAQHMEGEWSSTNSYEALAVVTNQGNSYTARQDVPIGVELTNTDYWTETGNWNAQIEAYRQEVAQYTALMNKVCKNYDSVNSMLSDTSLTTGNIVFCKSFYKDNNKGASFFSIEKNATANTIDTFKCENGLFAVRINIDYEITGFGAYCDGIHDDAITITSVIAKYKHASAIYPIYTTTPIIINGLNIEFNFYTIESTAINVFDISGVTINIKGISLTNSVGNGFIFANNQYSQNINIDIKRLFCANNVLTNGNYNFQSFYYHGNMWQYGNAIAFFTSESTHFIGNQNFFEMNFSMPGFGNSSSQYFNSEKYAFNLNCENIQFTGFNFYSVSFEQAGNGIHAYNMSGGKSIENLYIYSARTAEFSLNYKRKLICFEGNNAPITGEIFVDYCYSSSFDFSNFNSYSSPSFVIHGKLYYDFIEKPQYTQQPSFVEAQVGYNKLVITKLNYVSPSINFNTINNPHSLDFNNLNCTVADSGDIYLISETKYSLLGCPIIFMKSVNTNTVTFHIIDENNNNLRTITMSANKYHSFVIIYPTSFNYNFYTLNYSISN